MKSPITKADEDQIARVPSGGGSTWVMMPARSVRAKRRRSSAASTSAAVAWAAGVAGGVGLPIRDSSAGRTMLPERTVSGRRRAVELALRLFCIVEHK